MEENSRTILKPILKPLKILKFFGGLPLDIVVNEDGTYVQFSWIQGLKMVFLLFISLVTFLSYYLYDLILALIYEMVTSFF
jgi:hypothetical protein